MALGYATAACLPQGVPQQKYAAVAKALFSDAWHKMPMGHLLQIKHLRKQRGLTQEALAEAVGADQSTVQRWESGKRTPDLNDMVKLADALQVRPGELFLISNMAPLGPTLRVRGAVAAGVWKEAYEWPEDEWMTFTARADVTAKLEHRFGLRVDGDSMNEVYPHGTIIECVSTMGRVEVASGKRVVVLREDHRGEFEATVKELLIDADGTQWLVPRSTNPAFQTPIRMDTPEPGIVETRIIAVVVGSYRPE
jgi:transcriptional regulator with XRE-family HTH domain